MVGCGYLNMWSMVLSVDLYPWHWLRPVTQCLMWQSGSHLCMSLQVCIRLLSGRLQWTELMEVQLMVLIMVADRVFIFHVLRLSWNLVCIIVKCLHIMCCDPGLLNV